MSGEFGVILLSARLKRPIHTIDSNGYVKIIDRLKDVIKSGGEWIPSLQLED